MIPLPREKEMEGGIAPPASSCWNAWRSLAGATFVRLQRRCRRRPPPLSQNFPFSPPFFFGRPPTPTPGKKLSSAGEEAAKNQLLSLSLSFAVPPPWRGRQRPGKERERRSRVLLHARMQERALLLPSLLHFLSLPFRPTCVTSYYGCALPTGERECKRRPALALIFFPRVCSLKNCRASRARKRGGGR